MNCNTAIFYDLENITGLSGKDSEAVLSKIRQAVEQRVGQGKISLQRAYADWNRFQSKDLANSMLVWGVSPVHVFNTNNSDKLKNASDVCLIIDALDILYSKPYVENFAIVSGDGIFTLLINKLHEHGKKVIGLGYPLTSNALFVKSCDEFVDLGSLDTVTDIAEVKETLMQNKAVKKLPPNFPNNQLSLSLLNSGLTPISTLKASDSDILNAIKTMTNVIFTYKDSINLSLFHFYLNHFIQKFRTSRFGMKHLKDFVSFILHGSAYCLYTSENAIMLIKRELAVMPDKIIEQTKPVMLELPDGSVKDCLFDIDDGASFTIVKEATETKQVQKHQRKSRSKTSGNQADKSTDTVQVTAEASAIETAVDSQKTDSVPDTTTPENQAEQTENLGTEQVRKHTKDQRKRQKKKHPKKQENKRTPNTEENSNPPNEEPAEISTTVQAENLLTEQIPDLPESQIQDQPETPQVEPIEDEHDTADQTQDQPDKQFTAKIVPDMSMTDLVEQIDLFTGGAEKDESAPELSVKRLVKLIFDKLISSQMLTDTDISNLTNKDYCTKQFYIKYPVLKKIDDTLNLRGQRLEKGKPVYWLHTLELGGGRYYLFKEWNENKSGKPLMEWYQSIVSDEKNKSEENQNEMV